MEIFKQTFKDLKESHLKITSRCSKLVDSINNLEAFDSPVIRKQVNKINRDTDMCKKAFEEHLAINQQFYDLANGLYYKITTKNQSRNWGILI